jgi:Ca2+-binding RTX toxin-like protein
MFLRKARHIAWKNRSLLVAALVIAGTTTTAVAASTWTVIIGTSGNDTINKGGQPGNYRLWGLAGKDVLTGGRGNNILVGDGHCPPGARDDQYCDIEEVPGDGGDTLRGGGGNNTIFGGGGPNTMYGGQGYNYIESGPSTNVIYGGPLGDLINATEGSSTIYPGKGTNYVDARGPGIDHVYCTGKNDTVYADANDVVKNCAHVHIGSQASTSSSLRTVYAPGVRPTMSALFSWGNKNGRKHARAKHSHVKHSHAKHPRAKHSHTHR